ncbi:hypothetical protein GYMLUDRAFT_36268 [Collybiopsis luxurians FD-317 M1]|nr:hypothetical protein GYMLUDRAFT_36268 [Collybiopsis luxurians FD-317 M1]
MAPETYDVIFAGGGTAACIIAGRLAQADPSLKILIIEAGPHTRNLDAHVQPGRFPSNIAQSRGMSWYTSMPSEALGGRSLVTGSGCCVGGGSSVNFMAYTRAAASDYDDWEKLGNPGWGSKDLIPLARKVETYQSPSESKSTSPVHVHGSSGPIKISDGGHSTNVGREFLEVASQFDHTRQTSLTGDTNDFYTTNLYGTWKKYIDGNTGKRSDTAHNFIYTLDDTKHNLRFLTNYRVVRVIFEDNRAVGVEYAAHEDFKDDSGQSQMNNRVAYASRLVVLSSGAFGSPAILERSGIGSKEALANVNVPQLVDLPGVGENYTDHNLCTSAYFASEDSDCLDGIFSGSEEAIRPHLAEWKENGKGLIAHNSIDAGVKLRPTTPEDFEELGPSFKDRWETLFVQAVDKPVGLLCSTAGNFDGLVVDPPSKTFGLIFALLYPRAVGYTHISSRTNPWAPLKFKHGFLEDLSDVAILRWCYKRGRELARRTKSFRGEIPARHPKFPAPSTDGARQANTASLIQSAPGPIDFNTQEIVYSSEDNKAIDDYLRDNATAGWHSLGTCAMKPRTDRGVVDSRLNVYGVQRLKVADMSIAPSNVGANTYNTALIIGEKAFLIIAEDLGVSV